MRRGFSLAELQITMFLILLVLLMIASIGREYANISRQSTGKELTLQAATVGLDSVSRDLRCSVAVLVPASTGGPVSSLTLRQVNPNAQNRLFETPNPPPHPDHDLNVPAYLQQIDYRLAGAQLLRRVTDASGVVRSDLPVAEGLAGFTCELRPDHSVEVVLSVQEQKRVRRLSTLALLNLQGAGP